jgi:methyl-accepting chemotaxis protein
MNLSKMTIGGRLLFGFLSVLALLIIIVCIATWRMRTVDSAVANMVDNVLQKERLFSTWAADTGINGSRTLAVADSNDPARQEALKAKIKQTSDEISAIQKKLEGLDKNADETTLMSQIGDKRKIYVAARDEVFKAKTANSENVVQLMQSKLEPALDDYVASIRKLSAYQAKSIEQTTSETQIQIRNAAILLPVLGGVSIAIGLILSFLITRSIRRQLGGEPQYAVEVMEKIADGDLTLQVHTKHADHGSLLHAVRAMRDSLANIVGEVRSGTETIATASSEIATGNMDLSSRTEHQASSLEQTASSMEQLTSTVKQNAENANQADDLATEASTLAVKGGEAVAQVIDTMSSIHESSKRIVDIISVIDGIAFQTNILALNAAVEAARAGEQGRGFAVVAAEVRSLAQRSAGAAREIKSLIDDSVAKVGAGTQLVDQAGATMQQVVASVQRVSGIIKNIASASREQSAGIEQVDIAIREMDDVTQQNAALVEQSAAAAQSMQDQAANLTQVVSVFKLAPQQGRGPATAARGRQVQPSPAGLAVAPRVAGAPAKTAHPRLKDATRPPLAKADTAGDDWEEF